MDTVYVMTFKGSVHANYTFSHVMSSAKQIVLVFLLHVWRYVSETSASTSKQGQ